MTAPASMGKAVQEAERTSWTIFRTAASEHAGSQLRGLQTPRVPVIAYVDGVGAPR